MQEYYPNRFISVVAAGSVIKLTPLIYTFFRCGEFLSKFINNYFLYKIMAYIVMPRRNHRKSREMFIRSSKSIPVEEFVSWLVILSEVK